MRTATTVKAAMSVAELTALNRLMRGTGTVEAFERELAALTRDIHAPLANRLGIWQLKWELEDLAFRFLEPDTYRHLARELDETRADRERYIGPFAPAGDTREALNPVSCLPIPARNAELICGHSSPALRNHGS